MDVIAVLIVLAILLAQLFKGPPEDGPNPFS
jgi:hypothetical protein